MADGTQGSMTQRMNTTNLVAGRAKQNHDFAAEQLTLAYDGRTVIAELTMTVPAGMVTAIVGANACGKSTLLKGLARQLPAASGRVTLDGRDIRSFRGKEFARVVGILPQQPVAPEGLTVSDLVARGRYPHHGWFRAVSADDAAVIAEALTLTDTLDLADRRLDELSGGQRQRVWIAMLLAQDPDILLLDEPTTFLDVAHQVELLDLLHALNAERGTTVVMVLHELNLAARYADHLVVMRSGRLVGEGTPRQVLTVDRVKEAFGLDARVIADPVCGSPLVIPIGRFHAPSDPAPSTLSC